MTNSRNLLCLVLLCGSSIAAMAAVDVPFEPDFSKESTFVNWEIVDANRDGYSWQYDANNQLVRIYTMYTSHAANDDYLCLPAINMGAEDIYTLTFSVGSQASATNNIGSEKMRVTFGRNPSPSQNPSIFSDDDIRYFWNGKMKTVTLTLPVDTDGAYYVAFHCISPSTSYSLSLKDIKVVQDGAHAAPAAVGEFNATPVGEKNSGCLLTFTAPSTDADGSLLSSLEKIVLSRDGVVVNTFISPAPGSDCCWTDSEAPAGMHTYVAIPWAGGLEGARAETSLWLGPDTPQAVAALQAHTDNGDALLQWSRPAGVNGGWTEGCLYRIERIEGDEEPVVIASAAAGLEYRDSGADAPGVQRCISYRITPSTEAGEGETTTSNRLLTGTPYRLPYTENFGFGRLHLQPWTTQVLAYGFLTPGWEMHAMGYQPECPTIDGDDGMLGFIAKSGDYNFMHGGKVRISTPAFSLDEVNEPTLSFMLFHYDTTLLEREYDPETDEYITTETRFDDCVRVQVSVDNGEYTDLPGGVIRLNATNNGWTKYEFPLSAFASAERISIGLLGEADGGGNIFIDAFEICGRYAHDLELRTLIGNGAAAPGQKAEFVAQVVNRGASSTKNYTVDLYVDGRKVDSKPNPGAGIFAGFGEKLIKLSFTPTAEDAGRTLDVEAQLVYPEDECGANDCSEILRLEVPGSTLPAPESLAGQVENGSVTLTWEEPRPEAFMASVRDDLESLTAFATGSYGGYRTVDGDKAQTYGPSGASYPGAGEPNSWQVFEPRQGGVDIDLAFNRRWIAHSGNQSLASWGAREVQADDWLISSRLSGFRQTLSFWIKSACQAYEERFQVYYSENSTEVEDFVPVAQATYKPTSQWRQFSIELPQGARYFAIRGVSRDGFAQMIDDIDFVPAGADIERCEIAGYNVYRDGRQINEVPVTEKSYNDAGASAGEHEYAVTALYDDRESAKSMPLTVNTDPSVVKMAMDGAIRVWGADGRIWMEGTGNPVDIFSTDGSLICRLESCNGTRVSVGVSPGMYLVAGRKILVR